MSHLHPQATHLQEVWEEWGVWVALEVHLQEPSEAHLQVASEEWAVHKEVWAEWADSEAHQQEDHQQEDHQQVSQYQLQAHQQVHQDNLQVRITSFLNHPRSDKYYNTFSKFNNTFSKFNQIPKL